MFKDWKPTVFRPKQYLHQTLLWLTGGGSGKKEKHSVKSKPQAP